MYLIKPVFNKPVFIDELFVIKYIYYIWKYLLHMSNT